MRWVAFALIALVACKSAPAAEPVSSTAPSGSNAAPEPKRKVKVITETHIELLDPITFVPASATFEPTSVRTIDAMADTLKADPDIRLVAVQAYGADAVATFQARLGTERAQAIVDALVARGVDRNRLVADGDAQPPTGRSDMPTFLILKRTP